MESDQEGGGGSWGVLSPVAGFKKAMAGWNDDEEGSEGLFMIE
ncbi:hypothetical protein ACFLXT_01390 [Chloroflexota bacterium]